MKLSRFLMVAVAALVVGVLAGTTLQRHAPQDAVAEPSTSALAPHKPSSSTPAPTATRAGMVVGFSHDEDGARAAAMTYASSPQRWLYLADSEVEAAVSAIATPTAAPALTREALGEVRLAREGLAKSAGRVWWLVRPLAVRVESYAPERARVAVWAVAVLSAADVAMPQTDWTTVTVDLAWQGDDWRVDGITEVAGPTPMVGARDKPWEPEPFDEALAGFERVGVGEPT